MRPKGAVREFGRTSNVTVPEWGRVVNGGDDHKTVALPDERGSLSRCTGSEKPSQ